MEGHHTAAFWLCQVIFVTHGLLNLLHYLFIIFRPKLDSTIHWLLCNISINEIMRAIGAVAFAKAYVDLESFKGNTPVHESFKRFFNMEQDGPYPPNITEETDAIFIILVSTTLTMFLLSILIILQRYYAIDQESMNGRVEAFNKRHAVFTLALWFISAAFGAAFIVVRYKNPYGLIKYWPIYWVAQIVLGVIILMFHCLVSAKLALRHWINLRRVKCYQNEPQGTDGHICDSLTTGAPPNCRWMIDVSIIGLFLIGSLINLVTAIVSYSHSRRLVDGFRPHEHYHSNLTIGLFVSLQLYSVACTILVIFLLQSDDPLFKRECLRSSVRLSGCGIGRMKGGHLNIID